MTSSHARATRALLVDVAERLFAERGIAAVSLRTVGTEAGQRNNSAAQYHFGSRQGLVAAIVETRSAPVEERRAELVAAVRREVPAPTVPQLLELVVRPLAETIDRGPRTHYLRFLVQVMGDPAVRGSWTHAGASTTWVHRELRRRLPDAAPADFKRRLEWCAMTAVQVLADHELARDSGVGQPSTDQVVRELVAMQAALLECPSAP